MPVCVWAAGDCFSSVFGFILSSLFQKVEHTTLKTNQKQENKTKKSLKDLKLSVIHYPELDPVLEGKKVLKRLRLLPKSE